MSLISHIILDEMAHAEEGGHDLYQSINSCLYEWEAYCNRCSGRIRLRYKPYSDGYVGASELGPKCLASGSGDLYFNPIYKVLMIEP